MYDNEQDVIIEDEIKKNIEETVESMKRTMKAFRFVEDAMKITAVASTYFLTNKIIQQKYHPTGLYLFGKWGISYMVAAQVAKSLNGNGGTNGRGTE